MMNRLTRPKKKTGRNGNTGYTYSCKASELAQKLAGYENAEEQEKMIMLSFCPGDTVHIVCDEGTYSRAKVKSITIDGHKELYNGYFYNIQLPKENNLSIQITAFSEAEIGKNVFSTKEEAVEKILSTKYPNLRKLYRLSNDIPIDIEEDGSVVVPIVTEG